MSAPTNHWKLGLFVVSAVLIGLSTAVVLGARTFRKETVSYTSYFDEAVTGLEAGSPVTFRGVKIGNVSLIDVAPDRRHVEVQYELGVAVLSRIRLAKREGKNTKLPVTYDLRVQLNSSGLTGTKYLQIDFFDVSQTPPPPELPFPVAENYIPATPSTMKNLESAVVRAVDQFPVVAQAVSELVRQLGLLISDVHDQQLPDKAAEVLGGANQMVASANRLLGDFRRKLAQVKVDQLTLEARSAIGNMSLALVKLQKVLDRVDGAGGILANAERATSSLGQAATGARNVGPELSDTLRDVREAAASMRELLDALERDSDMLIKGRARAGE
jgi:paraquat-inducible protein B